MPRSVDHLVIATHDLDSTSERYRQLGFHVGARNRHPWGTENHIIQFDGAFLEIVGLGEGFTPPSPSDPAFPFAGFLAGFLTHREGLAMLALRSDDAEADRRVFAAAGWGEAPRFDFGRKGRRGDREVEVAFSLAFARPIVFTDAGFFVCQQRFPENFWDASAQNHPNGATGVAELVLTHPAPHVALPFLSGFLDQPAEITSDTLRFQLPGTQVGLPNLCKGLRGPRSASADGFRRGPHSDTRWFAYRDQVTIRRRCSVQKREARTPPRLYRSC